MATRGPGGCIAADTPPAGTLPLCSVCPAAVIRLQTDQQAFLPHSSEAGSPRSRCWAASCFVDGTFSPCPHVVAEGFWGDRNVWSIAHLHWSPQSGGVDQDRSPNTKTTEEKVGDAARRASSEPGLPAGSQVCPRARGGQHTPVLLPLPHLRGNPQPWWGEPGPKAGVPQRLVHETQPWTDGPGGDGRGGLGVANCGHPAISVQVTSGIRRVLLSRDCPLPTPHLPSMLSHGKHSIERWGGGGSPRIQLLPVVTRGRNMEECHVGESHCEGTVLLPGEGPWAEDLQGSTGVGRGPPPAGAARLQPPLPRLDQL